MALTEDQTGPTRTPQDKMAAIISTLSGENRIVMDACRWARGIDFLSDRSWALVRIGLRYCLADSGANLSSVSLHVGLCSGNTDIFGDGGSAPTHFFGINMTGNFGTLARTAGPPARYTANFTAGETWVNGALSAGSPSDMETASQFIGATDTNRTLLFVDIFRRTTNYSCRYFRNTSTAVTDVSKATFDAQVLLTTPTVTNHSFVATQAWACNEATNGYFDHVNLSWVNSSTIKISDIAVVRLA